MADMVSVQIDYSEIVDKTGTYTVDLDEVRLWLAGGDPTDFDETRQPTGDEIKEFLEAGDVNDVISALDDWEALNTDLHMIHEVRA